MVPSVSYITSSSLRPQHATSRCKKEAWWGKGFYRMPTSPTLQRLDGPQAAPPPPPPRPPDDKEAAGIKFCLGGNGFGGRNQVHFTLASVLYTWQALGTVIKLSWPMGCM
jgi:hypothetical protein